MKSRRNAARKLLELLLQTSLFFMTEKKLSVPLKVVVLSWPIKAFFATKLAHAAVARM